jgi:hypothetical protein
MRRSTAYWPEFGKEGLVELGINRENTGWPDDDVIEVPLRVRRPTVVQRQDAPRFERIQPLRHRALALRTAGPGLRAGSLTAKEKHWISEWAELVSRSVYPQRDVGPTSAEPMRRLRRAPAVEDGRRCTGRM